VGGSKPALVSVGVWIWKGRQTGGWWSLSLEIRRWVGQAGIELGRRLMISAIGACGLFVMCFCMLFMFVVFAALLVFYKSLFHPSYSTVVKLDLNSPRTLSRWLDKVSAPTYQHISVPKYLFGT